MKRLLCLLLFFVCGQSFRNRPNIIAILTDDQGWGYVQGTKK